MVLRMSISSVPGTNSVFFASLPIDYLPIDKVWGKVHGFDTPVKSRGRKHASSRTRGARRSRYFQTRRLSSSSRQRRAHASQEVAGDNAERGLGDEERGRKGKGEATRGDK